MLSREFSVVYHVTLLERVAAIAVEGFSNAGRNF